MSSDKAQVLQNLELHYKSDNSDPSMENDKKEPPPITDKVESKKRKIEDE